MSYVPHPAGLPDLFIDRSLGRIAVPRLLREAGLRLTTLAERYGIPQDELITDERWLEDAGLRGEAVFMKDARVRYNAAEKLAITRFSVRCFCLSRQDVTAAAMAERFLYNLERIAAACAERGPFVYAVHERRIDRLSL
jgi:hypothetical protein